MQLFSHSDKPMWEFKNRLCQMSSHLQLRCFKELGNVTVQSMLILGHDWLENETKLVLDWFKTNNSLIDQNNMPSNELPSKAIQIKIWRIFVIKLFTKWTTDIIIFIESLDTGYQLCTYILFLIIRSRKVSAII